MIRIYKTKDYDAMSLKAGEFLAAQVTIKPRCVIGLATGTTPIGAYNYLREQYEAGNLSFREVQTANLDEYVGLPGDDPNSYRYFMNTSLFDHIDIDPKNAHVPSGLGEDLEVQAKQYDQMIDENPVDIQILGIGSDGHIAFNEPGTPFDSGTHVCDLAESTIKDNCRFFDNDISKVPTQAVTQGIGTIMKAKNILLIATGANKAQAVKDMIEGNVDVACPASVLQNHQDVIVIVDEAAASLLSK